MTWISKHRMASPRRLLTILVAALLAVTASVMTHQPILAWAASIGLGAVADFPIGQIQPTGGAFVRSGATPAYLFCDPAGNRVAHFDSLSWPWDNTPTWIAVGSTPRSIAAGIFVKGSFIEDAVVANSGSGSVTVLKGGNGPATVYTVGSQPWAVVTGSTVDASYAKRQPIDFNGDGNVDVVVANRGSGTVSVLLGNGDATFRPAASFSAGSDPVALTVADFNRDGKLDVAVAGYTSDTYSMLTGRGDGTFTSPVTRNLQAGSHPTGIAAADLNGDGKQDLVIANSSTNLVSVMLGTGGGSFGTASSYATGASPASLILQDLDDDASFNLDIAVAASASESVSLLMNNDDGTFRPAVNLAAGPGPSSVAWLDDGNAGTRGLVVTDLGGPYISVVLRGQTIGSGFEPGVRQIIGATPRSVTTADFNRDGKPDLATANWGDDSVSVVLGIGGGRFGSARVLGAGTGSQPFGIAAGDLNGDGMADLVVSDAGTNPSTGNSVSVFLGKGDGTFQPYRRFPVGPDPAAQYLPRAVVVGEFNGDGYLDIAVTAGNAVSILLGNGDGTFRAPVLYSTGGASPVTLVVADFNNDGKPDIAAGGVFVLLNHGDGTFSTSFIGSWGSEYSIVAIDLDRDGALDIVAVIGGGQLTFYSGRGDGTFVMSNKPYFLGDQYANQLATGDFDSDGIADLAVTLTGKRQVLFIPGVGDGSLGWGTPIPLLGREPIGIVAGDWNIDGKPDVAVAMFHYDSVETLTQVPSGQLRVTTSPPLPSQILVDGTPMDTWGLNWVDLSPGSHTVSYRHVQGFTEPPPQTVNVTSGAITTLTGNFVQRGWLQVTTSPAVPAPIYVDGTVRDDWGLWTDLPTGPHQVCFGPVADYKPPPCQSVTLTAGATTSVTGSYTSSPGQPGPTGTVRLRVTTNPPLPSQILVNGVPMDTWGLNWVDLPAGHDYTISWTHVEGYTEPTPYTESLWSVGATVPGDFKQNGSLRVITSPAVPAAIFVDGRVRDDWGMWTDLPVGDHMVCFGPVAGMVAPPCQTVTLSAGTLSTVTGTYTVGLRRRS